MLVGGSYAQDVQWRPAPIRGAAVRPPAVTLGPPVPLAPLGVARGRVVNPGRELRPVSFVGPALVGVPRSLARAQDPETPLPVPLIPPETAEPDPAESDAGSAQETGQKPPAESPTLTMPRKAEPQTTPGNLSKLVPETEKPIAPPVATEIPTGPLVFEPPCPCELCCGSPSRWWVRGEYLLWWLKDSPLPPLVTTSLPGTPREAAGVLGAPGTAILFGGSSLNNEERSGGRFGFGFWFDPNQCFGLETDFFFLGERSVRFNTGSGGIPILARPIFDVGLGRESSELVAFPDVLAGNISVAASSRLWGIEENLRANIFQGPGILPGGCYRIGLLAGFRYLKLDESLSVIESLRVAPGVPMTGGSGIVVSDRFATQNNFYGGQLGAVLELRRGRWTVDLLGKVALGVTHEVAHVQGSTTFAVPGGGTIVQRGGLLALPTNIGRYSRDEFAVVPELGIRLGYQVTSHLRAFVGYNFLYWSDVARPGDQIDRAINVSQLPMVVGPNPLVGPARPAFAFRDSDFWAQGISFGLEFRY
jgi:hypothetical protein